MYMMYYNTELSKSFTDNFDGLMLSDGSIHYNSKSYQYHQSCKYKEWLDNIHNNFMFNNINSCIYPSKRVGFNNSKVLSGYIYHLSTSNCSGEGMLLSISHKRWYKKWYDIDSYNKHYWHLDEDGEYFVWRKIVPDDISLTPECVLNWYLGDGSIVLHNKKYINYCNSYIIQLATNGFSKYDIEYLINILNEKVVDCAYYNNSTIIISKKGGVRSFLSYICDLEIPDCYSYKFPERIMENLL